MTICRASSARGLFFLRAQCPLELKSTTRETSRDATGTKVCRATLSTNHHAHCLSPIQVAFGHLNGVLAMNMERLKSKNPMLKV